MKHLLVHKTMLVFIHTKLTNVEGDYKDVILAAPFWQAKYNKVFTSVSEDYVPYTPIAFGTI